jgi:hypothetical protein
VAGLGNNGQQGREQKEKQEEKALHAWGEVRVGNKADC